MKLQMVLHCNALTSFALLCVIAPTRVAHGLKSVAVPNAPEVTRVDTSAARAVNTRVSAFFYLWYGTPEIDGQWSHWDHSTLPHWTEHVRKQYPDAQFVPPHDVHSPFYPRRGPYSSRDGTTMAAQFNEMTSHGIGTAVISWWGRPGVSKGDSQGVVTDSIVKLVLDTAAAVGITIALHLEPYEGRSVESIHADLQYLHEHYGSHPALHRVPGKGPFLYVYDSYHIAPDQWARMLKCDSSANQQDSNDGGLCVRGTDLDAYFVGLWLNHNDGQDLVAGGFDGAYTYFAVDGFSYGSTTSNWAHMSSYCNDHGLLFVPSVGPGYDDSKIRPWNAHTRRERGQNGEYYRSMWEAALASSAQMVSVTSFNEWGEGTQIEPAVPRSIDVDALAPQGLALDRRVRAALKLQDRYSDYSPHEPNFYLKETLRFAKQLAHRFGEIDPSSDASGPGVTEVISHHHTDL